MANGHTPKHTPGPWRVVPDQPSHGCALCIENDTGVIVRTPEVAKYNNAEQRRIDLPNVEFIVKACNAHDALVAALRAILEYADNGTPVHPGALILDDARAAIAKATA